MPNQTDIEDLEAATIDVDEESKPEQEDKTQNTKDFLQTLKEYFNANKKLIYISLFSIFILIVLISSLIFLTTYIQKKNMQKINDKNISIDIITSLNQKIKKKKKKKTTLKNLIKKAKKLYEDGEVQASIDLYDKISRYEEFLTYHNIGVNNMNDKKYKLALDNFEKSIQNGENKCVSAINAAVASLYLNDQVLFEHYINLASQYLLTTAKDPLYNYYYSLIKYYKKNYVEALSVIRNIDTPYYKEEQYQLAGTMLSAVNDYYSSIEYFEKQSNQDYLTIGLLYAKIAKYNEAIKYLLKAKKTAKDKEILKNAYMALYMSYLKNGDIPNASKVLSEIIKKYSNKILKQYPIKLSLKDSIFNINKAQMEFKKHFNYSSHDFYKLFIYFSPYKIYNVNQSINYIRKSRKSININDVAFATNYLKYGNKLAKITSEMTKGIKLAINHKIRSANKIFKKLAEQHKFNSALLYNLGLSYAQLGLYGKAKDAFKKSYSLDSSNKLSLVLAIMSNRLAGLGDATTMINNLVEDIMNDDNFYATKEANFYLNIIDILKENLNAKYLRTQDDENILHMFFKIYLSQLIEDENLEKKYASQLQNIMGDNIVSNILYFYVTNKHESRKNIAQNAINFIQNNKFFLDTLYYGPSVAKEIYIQMVYISGMGYVIRDILREKLIIEKNEVRGIMQALAYIDIYLNLTDEAFSIYNSLIDDFDDKDSMTLFLASVAAIGANKQSNAIALLNLSILNKSFINEEARYALAMLYQEIFNIKATNLNLKKIKNKNFKSQYFNFFLLGENKQVN